MIFQQTHIRCHCGFWYIFGLHLRPLNQTILVKEKGSLVHIEDVIDGVNIARAMKEEEIVKRFIEWRKNYAGKLPWPDDVIEEWNEDLEKSCRKWVKSTCSWLSRIGLVVVEAASYEVNTQ